MSKFQWTVNANMLQVHQTVESGCHTHFSHHSSMAATGTHIKGFEEIAHVVAMLLNRKRGKHNRDH